MCVCEKLMKTNLYPGISAFFSIGIVSQYRQQGEFVIRCDNIFVSIFVIFAHYLSKLHMFCCLLSVPPCASIHTILFSFFLFRSHFTVSTFLFLSVISNASCWTKRVFDHVYCIMCLSMWVPYIRTKFLKRSQITS